MKRGGNLKPMSAKRQQENKFRKEAVAKVKKRSNGRCEGAPLIARVDPVAASNCRGIGVDPHEKLKRSRGGSITDPGNIMWLCRPCHDWTEDEVALATEVGMLTPSWDA